MKTLLLFALSAATLAAQATIQVTCIPEPAQYKNVLQLGCDAYNLSAEPATIPASELRRNAIQYINAPLRPVAADAQIERVNRTSIWGWIVRVVKWGGFAWSITQGFIPEDKLSDLERALPGGVAGTLQVVDAFVGENRETIRLPLDYVPEQISLAGGESESYTWFAMPQRSVNSFTVALVAPMAITALPMPEPRRQAPRLLFVPTAQHVWWRESVVKRLPPEPSTVDGGERLMAVITDYLQLLRAGGSTR